MKTDWSMNARAVEAGHKPYDPESEWQPGRWNHPENVKHCLFGNFPSELKALAGKPVRVRFDERIALACRPKYEGIGAGFCFEVVIHPDDARLYFPKEAAFFTTIGACTCCILTD